MEKQTRPDFLKLHAFAQAISASDSAVRVLIRQRKLPVLRLNGMLRIPTSVLDQFRQEAMAHVTADNGVVSK